MKDIYFVPKLRIYTPSTLIQYCRFVPLLSTVCKSIKHWLETFTIGERGATCHRGKLSHSHCNSKALIVMDFSNIYLKESKSKLFSKTSSAKFLLLCACIQFMTTITYPCDK